MFTKILIANRGDKARKGRAAQPKRMARAACAGDFHAEQHHV